LRELQRDPQRAERIAQLVPRIGDELARCPRVVMKPREERIERVAEALDLIACPPDPQFPIGGGLHGLGLRGHVIDGPKRPSEGDPPDDADSEDEEREGDEQRAEYGLLSLVDHPVARGRAHHDGPA